MFVFMTGLIFYLSLTVQTEKTDEIAVIELKGDYYLSKDKYLSFANLNNLDSYRDLSVSIIRDRIQKHPYISEAMVIKDGSTLTINIVEKRFEAILFTDNRQFFIDENLLLTPVLPFTRNVNYPVINNPLIDGELNIYKSVSLLPEVVTGLKIVSSIKYLNTGMYDNLSEVDMRNGKDIIVYFKNLDYQIVLGRESEITKIFYFSKLWDFISSKNINTIIKYIDLRFRDRIYMGIDDSIIEDGEKQS